MLDKKNVFDLVYSEYFKFLECFKERSLKNKKCTEKQIDTMTNFVREIFDSLIDFICGEHTEGSDKCETIGNFNIGLIKHLN